MERSFSKKCSKCGQRTVAVAIIPYEIQIDHDGRKHLVKIPDLRVPQCGQCGNIVFDDEASEQVSRAFRKQAGLLEPEEIQRRREKLGLSQAEVAQMLGVEAAELSRWESGQQIQQRTADRFLQAVFAVREVRELLAHMESSPLAPAGSDTFGRQ